MTIKVRIRRRNYWVTVIVALIVVGALNGISTPLKDTIQNLLFDQYQRWLPRPYQADLPVRIVDIDDESIRRLGQWPWPRARMAELVAALTKAEAAAIALDFLFSEPERVNGQGGETGAGDALFAKMIGASPVVLGAFLTTVPTGLELPTRAGFVSAGDDPQEFLRRFTGILPPLPALSAQAAGVGFLNWLPDSDRIVRRVPLLLAVNGIIRPSFAMEALRAAQGASTYIIKASNASGETAFGQKTGIVAVKTGDAVIPTEAAGEIRVYYARKDARRSIPAWKVLSGQADLSDLSGKIIFVGSGASLLSDIVGTPLDPATPGVEIHAQIVEQILSGQSLTRPDWAPGAEWLATILLGICLIVIMPTTSAIWSAGLGLVGLGALAGGSWYVFSRNGLLLDPVFPGFSFLAVFLTGVVALYGEKRRQERDIRAAFGRFVSPAVVARLAANPETLQLGGLQRELTVMFCDLRSFTTLSEGFSASELTQFLNAYLTPMTDIVLDCLGTVDKYMGDAIMAFWNAPLDDRDHAAHAAKAALAMRDALIAFNAHSRIGTGALARQLPEIKFGIGLNTGDCCVGNLGSTRRFDYSAIGDEVNVASRLEGASKYFGVDIVASQKTRDAAPGLAWLEIDGVLLKNKTLPVTVYALAGDAEYASTVAFRELEALHAEMLAAYRGRAFDDAGQKAREARAIAPDAIKGLYDFNARRFAKLACDALPADWMSVIVLDEK